MSLAIGRVLG